MQKCVRPQLVSLEYELPTDPAIAYSGDPPIIGCNHLVCGTCGADVHHVDGRSITTNNAPPRPTMEQLYDSPHPEQSPLLDARPAHAESRAYLCRCDWYAVDMSGSKGVNDIDADWDCAGHPSQSGKAA